MAKKKKADENKWRNSLNSTFIFTDFLVRYKLYRPFKHISPQIVNAIGMMFGSGLMFTMKGLKQRLHRTYKFMFPNASNYRRSRMYRGEVGYMGQLLMDTVLRIPNVTPEDLSHYVSFHNIDRLDEALSHKKGVILTSVHMAQFFYIFGIVYHQNHYPLVVVANLANAMLFTNILGQKRLPNFWVIGARSFESIKGKIIKHLNQNHVVFLMHDMGKGTHLRTTFWPGKYDFPWHTPQSGIALHRELGSPILPVVSLPDGEIGKSKIMFLDPSPLQRVDAQLKSFTTPEEKKHYHGAMSLELNKILCPYLAKYLHMWEEINNFTSFRGTDELKIPKNTTLVQFVELIKKKIRQIIEGSWEPERDDVQILQEFEVNIMSIMNGLATSQPSGCPPPESPIVRDKKCRINLIGLDIKGEIIKLLRVLDRILLEQKEPQNSASASCREFIEKVPLLFPQKK
jgi:lauroyl/myristoyl acyltransferase